MKDALVLENLKNLEGIVKMMYEILAYWDSY